ncbi:unnamed protein product [Bursaphelenchus xylophilus]|uniref:(pine wood nematode) hypothetical protein n=1 Tax=Bursaphelenchus xylophilus TaxID=6326 RepID=A0A1I7RZT8_BURXY|nr:unnamed protein product [Bursaphelenchus xylophilus]CAG9109243.1 unnamed protein product [Bursaphelenchus xylophilus]
MRCNKVFKYLRDLRLNVTGTVNGLQYAEKVVLIVLGLFSVKFLADVVVDVYWLRHQKLPPRTCRCNNENFCFTGLDATLSHINGSAFPCELYPYIQNFNLLQNDINNIPNDFGKLENDWTPVFVTSASSNHFYELRQYVNVIRINYKKSKIVVYDVGLNGAMVDEVKSWCLVEYRYFNFKRYPGHVNQLMNYAFKIVIADALKTYKNFFYTDTSVRFLKNFHIDIVRELNRGSILPFMTFTFSDHGIYGATDPGMLQYIPVPSNLTKSKEWQSTLLVTDSKYTRTLLKWFVLCALTEDCISPPTAQLKCNFYVENKITMEMGCHRYDQTFWNLYQLSYIFDPIQRGALKMGLIDKWPEVMGEKEVRNILTQMGYRWVTYSKSFRTKRNDVLYGKMNNSCVL